MNRIRTGLLAAIAVIALPAIAQAQDREERRRDRSDGERVWQHPDRPGRVEARTPLAPPPQADRVIAPAAREPTRGPAFGRGVPVPTEQRAQWQRNRDGGGAWGGGENRAVTPPPANNQRQSWQDRGGWRDGRDVTRQVEVDRGDRDNRRWDGQNRQPGGDRRWDRQNQQWNAGDRRFNDNDRRWDNDRERRGDDRRWRGDNRRWDNHDSRFGNGRNYGLNLNWHNDHRYNWRGWRETHRDLFRWRYAAPRGYHYRPVWRGFFLEPFFYGSSYWLADPFEYRLPPVEWPLRWVRYYDDALLVDVTTGEVIDVVQDFFW